MAKKTKNKKKQLTDTACYFSSNDTEPNYKEVLVLRRFISDRGKLIPASRSGVCSKHQRSLSREVKKSRFMALLPYTDHHAI
ncbi:MAG: 30S ribosomal protein S18 [Patescibacteria group bacterium]